LNVQWASVSTVIILRECFFSQTRGGSTAAQPTEEDRAKAEELKNEGTHLFFISKIGNAP